MTTSSGHMSLSQKQEGQARVPAQPIKKSYEYFEEIKAEFGRISWTEGEEVLHYAKIVVACTFVSAMVIYLADLVIHRLLGGLDAIFKLIFG